MSDSTKQPNDAGDPSPRNEATLCGRLVHDPATRTMPSGDTLVTLRVSVPRSVQRGRPAEPRGRRGGADWMDCALWTSRLRRASARWRAGDWVEVTGVLRRRYFSTNAGGATLVELDVRTARRVRRADRSQSERAALH